MTRKPHDPLADHLARRRINEAQFRAAHEFRKHHGMAGNGQPAAGKWLTKCRKELGEDGSAIVHDALIGGMTAKQIATARGLAGEEWQRYYAKRFQECLNTLAEVYGFANGERKHAASLHVNSGAQDSPILQGRDRVVE